ncbi:Aminoacyl-tRNA hydrolase [Alkaliphilus metalliredigens QYMF]|uniref:Peptidyl-tRNA hydrolase n=1 Tax=Alkaliphilus metalliredigens (strain QYMF) TaxID=293826 RepID=PTH_ALKMQ|nr:aminoacyl-tRNA hydrolase [Alkaliphilus metalliredigens]A6TJM7.1 RecName: Full=Peptidyl-tRNA hydrolase; Short=PTH [Alkaliphilus metalliredigens QYMF]ABR46395.1 Aminoacyl-tRNA hydrolase [Alkaliphilus metalliredigens QYMF]
MYIIVGLGNPGKKYSGTRHNVGFDVIDLLAHRLGITVNKLKHKALYGEARIGGEKVILAKPQTFMNLSGESIREMMQFYKIDPENLIVIYDDIDVKVGSLRIRQSGSAGTHNGMKSTIYQLQTDAFPRIRIGVGRPEFGDLSNYVLGSFTKDEIPLMKESLERATLTVESIVIDGIDKAMNRYNG